VAILAGFIVVGFEQINSRKYAQYDKVKNYNRARKIYDSIEEHVRKQRFRYEECLTLDLWRIANSQA
jgi:hypothetical protein